jgi:hypothetical protein
MSALMNAIEQTGKLASDADAEATQVQDRATKKQREAANGGAYLLGPEAMITIATAEYPKTEKLREYLGTQDLSVLRKMVALYYSGRERQDFDFFNNPRSEFECIEILSHKPNLQECLWKGLEEARKRGIDLEAVEC